MSPTYDALPAFVREYARLSREQTERFTKARGKFVKALQSAEGSQPKFPAKLRVKRVSGSPGVWEMTFAPDGRATFEYGGAVREGQTHIIWRRIGDHSIFDRP